ncbi:MAG: metal ABC transporter substrate-binding protein [Mesorhizobium sp.]|uniref:zinc ABC transporter substrate-binding protein AztC n=1 Tax=unclassified Mesorhizobium TaxID=325217 RepID=UPI000F75D49B|nr:MULTISPECIES: zinc ABC transporter substrate-binding protein AztC [unclassified Mesorhizobium]AZO66582.1 metal ABC transporter substrate-binding protein [Mesorhizobium sp. M6A.T.Cr.TU.016.01.1.1]RUU36446.1 metal ABC transporter substrate-binding protein [Mesorhizobium sp. M6A.T.Ce.TU.002.03.1.1]RUU97379.1 metal ABC transporter substrate-binding protein [Mesorhizobium sp. M6A.T.Cr.TU.017.01.1.1]RWP52957.1 MAG: metal ABC transporter substrate-binding protein [Mesorhizobium sp.]RWP72342.1 MAG:
MSRTLKLAALVGVITSLPITLSVAAAENLKVVASFSIIADFARNVGGDRVDIIALVGPNGDAHVYEPKPADAAAVGSADVVLVNGLQFEGFLQRLVEASATKAPIVELTKGGEVLRNTEEEHHHDHDNAAKGEEGHAAEAEEGHEEPHHHHGESDPHAWQSVHNAEVYVKNIANAFCAADAAGCDTYRANAESYGEQIEALEEEIKAAVAEIPEGKRTIITSHDAFGYFEHEYGIKFLAPEGLSTESEASAADVAALIKQIRQDKASAIFVENVTNPRLIEQIASETGLKVGGELYSDALSGENGPAATYIEMMRHNITTIKGAILAS